jgi:hypothetical protein
VGLQPILAQGDASASWNAKLRLICCGFHAHSTQTLTDKVRNREIIDFNYESHDQLPLVANANQETLLRACRQRNSMAEDRVEEHSRSVSLNSGLRSEVLQSGAYRTYKGL